MMHKQPRQQHASNQTWPRKDEIPSSAKLVLALRPFHDIQVRAKMFSKTALETLSAIADTIFGELAPDETAQLVHMYAQSVKKASG